MKGKKRIDRVFFDLPEPWTSVTAAADALKPGGIMLCYLPTMRQVDQLVLAILDEPRFAMPDVAEVIVRPWMADRTRLRPVMRMVGHSGFLVRVRRRGPKPADPKGVESTIDELESPPASEGAS
jgi:tRNA (adenine57-N1/adenine58-N1)-methyltransferase